MYSSRPFLLFLLTCILIQQACSNKDRKTYIVYMGVHPKGMDPSTLPSLHSKIAQNVLGRDFEPGVVLHSYQKSFNGFVVKLTEDEAETLAELDDVVSVFPNKNNRLHTTKSWDFIGLPQNVKRLSLESDIIVGLLDTGIWPESKSFSDEGFGPPPKKWKGSCHNFTCNNKIIGARYFDIEGKYGNKKDIKSPRDVNGHGSHCASTIAGNIVSSVSLDGYAAGTARGGVPSARIAVYKVCWEEFGCDDANILAAFDWAIADGVDVLSVSLGQVQVTPFTQYFQDSINIGSFHAMQRGVLTSNSANNLGPDLFTMTNFPPWLLSVAASTFGRKFVTKVQLGNGKVYEGSTINTFDLKNKMFPLISARDIPNTAGGFNSSVSRFCNKDSVDKHAVKGKIVLCERRQIPTDVGFFYGAAGVIFGSLSAKDLPNKDALPATFISVWNLREIQYYIKSTRDPTATIFKSEEIEDSLSPYVASFSSRGPNPVTPNILKPDIAAPGVNVIAAWTPLDPISEFKDDNRRVRYQISSGTSMACPHAVAAAAYVKSFHPNWSPAMIKSALMTTVTPMRPSINPEAEFAYGAGLISPVKATSPGLVYDISEADYVEFLCGEGYTDKQLRILTQDKSNCKGKDNEKVVYSLNLPSFALNVNGKFFGYVYHRTVTNVGSANSTYKARVTSSPLLEIQVKPDVLSFTSIGQKKSFSLTIEGNINVAVMSASLIWDDGNHQVRSPIVVYAAKHELSHGS
ncbi:cucumisin-like [Vicia villosa]|uniref:cucumisin-like n=1 Tax=Vicia villosa TaxID=3911 RepID=UPI00273C73F7|nr:cucumisin-like [Vicia villosa]